MSSITQISKLKDKEIAEQFQILHNLYVTAEQTKDTKLLKLLSDYEYNITLQDNQTIEQLNDLLRKYPSATNLYVEATTKLMEKLHNNKIVFHHVLDSVEQMKNELLDMKEPLLSRQQNDILLTNYRLVTCSKTMLLREMFESLNAEFKFDKQPVTFAEFYKKTGCGVILMRRITPVPIEFRSYQLLFPLTKPIINASTDAWPVEKESHPGVNNDIIRKNKTIFDLAKSKKWDFSNEIIGDDASKFIIVETVDGESHRFLAPWLIAKNTYTVPKHYVKKMMEDMKSKIRRRHRSTNVAAHQCNAGIGNMFMKRQLDHDKFDNFINLPTHKLLQVLQSMVISHMRSLCDKKKMTRELLYDVFHTPEIQIIVQKISFDLIDEICLQKISDVDEDIRKHLYTNFLVMLTKFAANIIKNMHDQYLSISNDELKEFEFYEKIVTEIIEISINHRDNIYAELQYMLYLYDSNFGVDVND